MYARVVKQRLSGKPLDGPTMLLCDAEASLRAATGEASVQRLKHELRRAAIVTFRIGEGELKLGHIPDASNFVDFLTKWVSFVKVEASLRYLYGIAADGPAAPPAHCLLAVLDMGMA